VNRRVQEENLDMKPDDFALNEPKKVEGDGRFEVARKRGPGGVIGGNAEYFPTVREKSDEVRDRNWEDWDRGFGLPEASNANIEHSGGI
jgi:hypothetical protein